MTKTMCNYILFCLIALSCNQESKLELKYDEATIKAVMQDLYVASSALKDVKEKDSLTILYKKQIEQIHKVKLSEVEKDISLLQQHPEKYNELHSAVRDSIAMAEKRMTTMAEGEDK